MSNENEKTKAEPRVQFVLAGEHTHAGQPYQADDVITLRESQAKRLEAAGTGKIKGPAKDE